MPYKLNPFTKNFDYYEVGSGSADLATVLANGNISGLSDIRFDPDYGLLLDNTSRLRNGTIDAGLGGSKGIAQICGAGYELKWEAGRLYVMGSSGNSIRWSLYNFTTTPTVNDDDTNGYQVGSLWTLDDGSVYVCTDATTGAAVWSLEVVNLNDLNDVTIATPANNDALIYESATSLWKNKTIATALGFTPVTDARTITINGTSQDLSANRTFTIADSAGWSYIVKSANQDVTNSAVLVDDTELQFSVVAGGQYMVELDAVISANNTAGDYANAFFVSAGTMKGQGIQNCNSATSVAQVISVNANAVNVSLTTPMGTLIADIDMLSSIKIIYSFTASANAVFSYRFSNVAAAAGRISRTWKGSILKYKKIN